MEPYFIGGRERERVAIKVNNGYLDDPGDLL